MRARHRSKAGFTIIEAMAAMIVTGFAISIVLAAGTRGPFRGMMLGNRALATIDGNVDRAAFDDLIGDLVIPPLTLSSTAAEAETQEVDDSFIGAPDQVAGYLVSGRDTPCAPTGTEGRVILSVKKTGDLEVTVSCDLTLDDGTENDPVDILKLRWPDAAFSYSEDGSQWLDDWEVDRGMPVDDAIDPNLELRKVFIRLTSSDGRSQMVHLATSGRHIAQTATAATNGRGGANGAGGAGGGGAGGNGRGGGPNGGGPNGGPNGGFPNGGFPNGGIPNGGGNGGGGRAGGGGGGGAAGGGGGGGGRGR